MILNEGPFEMQEIWSRNLLVTCLRYSQAHGGTVLKRAYSFAIVFVLIVGVVSSFGFVSATPAGVHVETLVFSVISQGDEQVLALLNDEIDLIGNTIDPTFIPSLEEAEDI